MDTSTHIQSKPQAVTFSSIDLWVLFLVTVWGVNFVLIKSALKSSKRRMRLFYANRDKPSVIFDAEFDALAKANPGRFEIVHHLDATQGITKPEEIVATMKGFEKAEAYLCGPGPFMSLVEETLFEHGMPHDRVRIERFEASGNDAAPRG